MMQKNRRSALKLGAKLAAAAWTALAFAGPVLAQAPAKTPVTVFAAASMKTALDGIATVWKSQGGGETTLVYGNSAALAKQIENGAPADLFVSADLNWMDYLQKANLIQTNTRKNLAGNTLVLIEPADAKGALKITPGFDLAGATGDGKIAVCTIASCPGGIYAKESLETLGVFAKVEPKLAQADNIRNALALVSRGEARFGVVYGTDAKADPKVKVVGVFPEATHSPIVYPAALTATSTNADAAKFLAFLFSPAAKKLLAEQGFTPPPK